MTEHDLSRRRFLGLAAGGHRGRLPPRRLRRRRTDRAPDDGDDGRRPGAGEGLRRPDDHHRGLRQEPRLVAAVLAAVRPARAHREAGDRHQPGRHQPGAGGGRPRFRPDGLLQHHHRGIHHGHGVEDHLHVLAPGDRPHRPVRPGHHHGRRPQGQDGGRAAPRRAGAGPHRRPRQGRPQARPRRQLGARRLRRPAGGARAGRRRRLHRHRAALHPERGVGPGRPHQRGLRHARGRHQHRHVGRPQEPR